ncbi:MAG: hypothetical protein ACI9QC_000534 [Oceanicoccus sp.]|jgi:hypothetical protein
MPQEPKPQLIQVASNTLGLNDIAAISGTKILEWILDENYFLESVFPIYVLSDEPTFLVTGSELKK